MKMFSENKKKSFSLSIPPSQFWPVCASKPKAKVRCHPFISSLQFVQQCLWPCSAHPPEVWKGSLDYSASDPFNPLQPASRARPTRRPARGPSGLYAHWVSSASVPCMPRGPRVLRPLKLRAPDPACLSRPPP
jgi:hypothetical protein